MEGLDSQDIKYWNTVPQETYGLLSICFAIVGGLYILWQRAFKLSQYQLTHSVNAVYIIMQVVSVVLGYFYFKLNPVPINVILTTFTVCPMILITYSAFYGIWVSNDFSCYESSFVQSQDFNPKQIA